jgi:molybdopterin-guanine dinucleotide biosynthesis protein A
MAVDYAAVILAGGTAVRMGGVDKAGVEYAGRTLLEHALAAVHGAVEVVVVGDAVPTSRPATFVREDPPHGGPAAGLLAGRDALLARPAYLAALAVDMPRVGAGTFERLLAAADGHDGAFLADASGRRALVGVLDLAALDRVRPSDASGLPLRRLLAPLDLAEVDAEPGEARDVDTWGDLRDLGAEPDG